MTDESIRQYPDERREQAETDMLGVVPAEPESPCCTDPTCACDQVNEAGRCECARWDDAPAELTAEEARNLADDLGLQLYRAQDALAFAAECCDIAEREKRAITIADVREWLKGARCGRQLAADSHGAGFVIDPAAPPLEFVTWDGPRFTYRPVTPEMEAAATERARQAAADSEKTATWFAANGGILAVQAATEATEHRYLSTGCFHGDHDYCKSMTGLDGAKRPASCKKCGAKCICPCHVEERP